MHGDTQRKKQRVHHGASSSTYPSTASILSDRSVKATAVTMASETSSRSNAFDFQSSAFTMALWYDGAFNTTARVPQYFTRQPNWRHESYDSTIDRYEHVIDSVLNTESTVYENNTQQARTLRPSPWRTALQNDRTSCNNKFTMA